MSDSDEKQGRIGTVEKFRALVNVGDTIWYIRSKNHVPIAVVGPRVVKSMTPDGTLLRVILVDPDTGAESRHYDADLVARTHGVFFDPDVAQSYL